MSKLDQPTATPPVVDRARFEEALADQVAAEKEVTRHNDRVSASRRRLPMVEVEDYAFAAPEGPVRLSELFGDGYLLLVQNVMFGPDWDEGCPSCTWAVDNLPANMARVADEGIAFAMVSHAPVAELEEWRARRGWQHRWVSSHDTTYHWDWGWTQLADDGSQVLHPGYSYYLLSGGKPYLTYTTRARGTEAVLATAHIMDRTVYGRQQDWEDSPRGWPQEPTYG
ncbi:DUF899 family protein [Klenkia taihuensis]|uniref:Predicted dithiol-disulfide oxidoreductase, DUF899 family n=1 Tax=Klenkia taihuensis TaxID=1225127 RepID=A0A1I1QJF1_9ACTN|nr:DUF899 family protein [Klenkia taihuensis]GHE08065.1 hypothetical protein GCM10011381_07200 [Klenkia taihuensis]SFD18240.1 Predicted dithiol-disulfide oxidoreductase, DUF899 family [Klenkia taihuensis]